MLERLGIWNWGAGVKARTRTPRRWRRSRERRIINMFLCSVARSYRQVDYKNGYYKKERRSEKMLERLGIWTTTSN